MPTPRARRQLVGRVSSGTPWPLPRRPARQPSRGSCQPLVACRTLAAGRKLIPLPQLRRGTPLRPLLLRPTPPLPPVLTQPLARRVLPHTFDPPSELHFRQLSSHPDLLNRRCHRHAKPNGKLSPRRDRLVPETARNQPKPKK